MSELRELLDTHDEKINELERKFSGYVFNVDKSAIRNWLKLFGAENFSLGLKLLDYVDYYDPSRLVRESIQLHNQLLAYKAFDNDQLISKQMFFIDFSPTSGKSQDEFIPKYRLGSNLRYDRYDKNFIYFRDVPRFMRKKGVILVFLTDFIGSGKEVIGNWFDIVWALSNQNEHILLALCGYDSAIRKIEKITKDRLTIIMNKRYSDTHKIFSPQNTNFTNEEKQKLLDLCKQAGKKPTGFRNTQATTIFYFRCPNSTISILRARNRNWKGLFKRHLE